MLDIFKRLMGRKARKPRDESEFEKNDRLWREKQIFEAFQRHHPKLSGLEEMSWIVDCLTNICSVPAIPLGLALDISNFIEKKSYVPIGTLYMLGLFGLGKTTARVLESTYNEYLNRFKEQAKTNPEKYDLNSYLLR